MKQCFCELGLARMGGRAVWVFLILMGLLGVAIHSQGKPRRLLLDTDMDTDDLFAILYLLKQNRSLIDLQAITINTNAWNDAGHAVNQLYDMLYMMDRDDIPVGVGGEGGILDDGTILPNVGGYLPLIEQRNSTFGYCRYRQAIPVDRGGGRLDIDTNYGIRRAFLPQGDRRYSPLSQPTVQQVMTDVISAGPTTVLLIGAHTNFAIFLMTHPQLKNNIEHIYIMGGGVRSKNPTGCCPSNASSSCISQQCGDQGNLFTAYKSNPYAEFNMFGDPFAAYQVIHSGIPITLVPLDATNTIPVTEEFYNAFKGNQNTYEAQYCFRSLNMVHDTWFDNGFYTSYFMWDSFTSGVVVSIISNEKNGQNDFAEMEYINLTVVTSNKPYGIHDGSNPFFDGRTITKLNLNKDGIHSGHVQTGIQDPFCMPENITEKGKCEDGYTKEVNDTEDAVRVLVAEKAKPNKDKASPLEREFFVNFLYALNLPVQSGRFNFSSEFPFYKQIFYKPDLKKRKLGKPVVFDMDMSIGDFISLLYLLKTPAETIDLKAVLVNGNGWANIATIDAIYDILHMMGRDDIPVGLGSVTPLENPSYSCKYVRYIPHGSGGLLDSDTLYGFARNLPRSPRSYTVENSVRYGAPRNTKHPELRQPSALEVWQNVSSKCNLNGRKKITILTNGPLTNVANIIRSNRDASSTIQSIFIVGGHLSKGDNDKGNIFTMPSNEYSEFNLFLDPIAAKTIIEAKLDIKLIPLVVQRNASSFPRILEKLQTSCKTPELTFTQNLLSLMYRLQQENQRYNHMDIFLGEILGAVVLVGDSLLKASMKAMNVSVVVDDITRDGQLVIDDIHGQPVHVLSNLDTEGYYDHIVNTLGNSTQTAVIGSFDEQKITWSRPPRDTQKIH